MLLDSLQVREQVEVWVTAHPNTVGQSPGCGPADSISVQLRTNKTKIMTDALSCVRFIEKSKIKVQEPSCSTG